jgi:hypothetical protein
VTEAWLKELEDKANKGCLSREETLTVIRKAAALVDNARILRARYENAEMDKADLRRQLTEEWARCGLLGDEAARLKRGDFTEEEFQGLCHNLPEECARRFGMGCVEYNRKLAEKSPPNTTEAPDG